MWFRLKTYNVLAITAGGDNFLIQGQTSISWVIRTEIHATTTTSVTISIRAIRENDIVEVVMEMLQLKLKVIPQQRTFEP